MKIITYVLKIIIFINIYISLINGLSKKDFIFYTIKLDNRDCEFPKCGGYWLQRINSAMPSIYVSSISLDSTIVNFNMSLITLALTDDLILGGLILHYPKFSYFQIWNATRLIYTKGNSYESLYGPQLHDRQYQYISIYDRVDNVNRASGVLDRIEYNENKKYSFHPYLAESINLNHSFRLFNYTEIYSKIINNLDVGWLHNQITNSKTINYGFMNKDNNNFQITKIYLNIPIIGSNTCNDVSNYVCSNDDSKNSGDEKNLISTYHRDNSRCLYFSGCVNTKEQNLCENEEKMPNCPKGYTINSFPVRPYGCNRYYCDVSFISG